MKKIRLALLISVMLILPARLHAQGVGIPFGGLDDARMAFCDCTPTTLDPSSAYLIACVEIVALPPLFFFDIFAPLWIGGGTPIGGFLAIPIELPLAFPNYTLLPEEWVLGELEPDPVPPVCGISIPVFCTHGVDVYPADMCVPILLNVYGVIGPATGTAPGGFF